MFNTEPNCVDVAPFPKYHITELLSGPAVKSVNVGSKGKQPPKVISVENSTSGKGFTITSMSVVSVHPLISKPTTVYVSVIDGTNSTLSITEKSHTYVSAPSPQTNVLSPAQIKSSEANAEITGNGFTTTSTVSLSIQPFAAVPITTYSFVSEGTNASPSSTSLFQRYNIASPVAARIIS